jgi:putative transposase
VVEQKETNPKPLFKTSTELRREIEWLNEISAASLQQKQKDFDVYRKQLFSKARSKKLGFPQFKKKSEKQSYRLPNQKFSIKDGKIRLERIGYVKLIQDRQIPDDAKLLSVTISKTCTNKYYVSICVEQTITKKQKTNEDVGVDLGIKSFATLSNNDVIANPKYLRENQSKLIKIQKHYSRKEKGSNRQKKCRLRLAKLHEKIANQRNYFIHNVTSMLVNKFDNIVIEDLNVEGMVKNHNLAQALSDVSFGEFRRQLEYKALWYGKNVIVADRFSPSSKTCSCCGYIMKDLKLSDRTFSCPNCNTSMDRDLNAAINLKAFRVQNAIRT